MFKIKNYFICIIVVFIIYPSVAFTQNSLNAEKSQTVIKKNIQKTSSKDVKQAKEGLTITPQEINLGTITAEKSSEGMFTLRNSTSEVIDWSTEGPEGWKKVENQKLSGALKNNSSSLRVELRLLPKESLSNGDKKKNEYQYVEMKIDTGGGKLICRKEFQNGTHKEEIKINSSEGQKTIFVTFVIIYTQKSPLIRLNPWKLDMGSVLPEKTVFKKIILNNSGKEKLTWSVAVRKHEKENIPENFQNSRYISFANEETLEGSVYFVPAHLKETVELTGQWTEKNGYPSGAEGENLIKINFSGTGIILYLLTFQKEGEFVISLDKQLIDGIDLFEDLEENEGELLIADKLADGSHVLTITSNNNHLIFEGFKILGVKTSYFPEGSIKIVPDSGATTRQSNYLKVSLNTGQMLPGYYVDDILFATNGGEAVVEVSAEVLPEDITKVVDIYRYYNGADYLFTADPQSEAKRLIPNNYAKEGIAFRLFKPDTPGTTCFYRWYNPQRKSHFYHYNQTGGGKDLRGYIFEGSIGNIATSRLTNTRELYRWYNSKTGYYFYTTDIQGGKINKRVFRFDGIAGYVK